MKIEQIIILHLYKNKQVTLQGIGTFYLSDSITPPLEVNNLLSTPLPENAVRFEYNETAGRDLSLIDAIVQHTKKLKSLAEGDLDSFVNWQKQLLNIRQPFNLEPLGTLQRTPEGRLIFFQKKGIVLKADKKSPAKKYLPASIKYSKKMLPAILLLLGLILITWILFQFAGGKPGKTSVKQTVRVAPVNSKINLIKNDISNTARAVKKVNGKNDEDIFVFKIVFLKTTAKEQALKLLDQIYGFGHSATLYSTDSVYEIAMPFDRPLTDTLKVKDSLNEYYSLGTGYVETK